MAKVVVDITGNTKKFQKELKDSRDKMRGLKEQSNESNRKMQQNFKQTSNVVGKLALRLGALFSVALVTGFIKKIIQVRSEFEKYAAVLKNTLGSQQAAAEAMKMLRDFAARTPFSVQQLTGAFVKLVNQGFKPTEEEMRKLGDLSASTGKEFDQLAEAIIDAQTGEFERLKEFGIRAKKEGDKVTFTFKEQQTQVDFTASSIQEYILSLGDAEGVSGAMAAISETLGGKVSNLGDAWDTLLDAMGGRTSGVFSSVITYLSEVADKVAFILEKSEFSAINEANKGWEAFADTIADLDEATQKQKITDEILNIKNALQIALSESQKWEGKDIIPFVTSIEKQREIKAYRQVWQEAVDTHKEQLDVYTEYLTKLNTGELVIVKSTNNLDNNTKAVNLNKKAYKEWLAALKETADLEAKELAEAGDMLDEAFNGVLGDPDKYDEYINIPLIGLRGSWMNTLKLFKTDYEASEDAFTRMMADGQAERDDIAEKDYQDYLARKEAEKQAAEDAEMKKRAMIQKSFDIAFALTDLLATRNQAAMNEELLAVGDNEEKKDAIRKKYAKKEQSLAVSRAIMSGAESILKNTAELGFIPAIPVNVLQAILTGIQIATIKAQKFATGVLDLQGPGTATSDSIPARLSRHESVMTARETKDYYPYLKAMKDGTFARFELALADRGGSYNLNYDNSKEIKELKGIRELLKTRPTEHEYIQGGHRIIKKGSVTTRISLN